LNSEKHRKFLGVPQMLAVSGFALAASVALIYFIHANEITALVKASDGTLTMQAKSIWFVILEHLATALFILGAWHTIDQLIVKKEFKTEIVELMDDVKADLEKHGVVQTARVETRLEGLEQSVKLAKHDTTLGLSETYHNADAFPFSAMIRDTHSLTAVLADGYSWVGRNSEAFMERFADPEKKTTIILVHPDSDIIPVLSRKVGMQPELYRQRIYSTIRELIKLNAGRSKLKILGHSLINCHSVFIADRREVFSPYFMSTERRSPPIFALKDTGNSSFFGKLSQDVAVLERECSPILEQLALDYGSPVDSARKQKESNFGSLL
jgi:hypothetical protein